MLRRFGPDAALEWRRFASHFELGQGFSLIFIVVPDDDGAKLCRRGLAEILSKSHSRIDVREFQHASGLLELGFGLLTTATGAGCGAIWLEATPSRASDESVAWRNAWRGAAESLNQQRNPIRRAFIFPVIFCITPWLLPLFREAAPDLWSVRSQVVWMVPDSTSRGSRLLNQRKNHLINQLHPDRTALDPELALMNAQRLESDPSQLEKYITMLIRAGIGFARRDDFSHALKALWLANEKLGQDGDIKLKRVVLHQLGSLKRRMGEADEAEGYLRSALALESAGDTAIIATAATTFELGILMIEVDNLTEAEMLLKKVDALEEANGHEPWSRGITNHELAHVIFSLGRSSEAEHFFRRALLLKQQGGASKSSLGATLHGLALAVMEQEHLTEAEDLFRWALLQAENGSDTDESRALSLVGLGQSVYAQGRLKEAEVIFRQAILLIEFSSDAVVEHCRALDLLGRSLRQQGRPDEAEPLFRKAVRLLTDRLAKDPAYPMSIERGVIWHELGTAIRDQGRPQDAELAFRTALDLKESGNDTPLSLGTTLRELGKTLADQGRLGEAKSVLDRAVLLLPVGVASPLHRGKLLHDLASVLLSLDRIEDAESVFREALTCKEEAGDTKTSILLTADALKLAEALSKQSGSLKPNNNRSGSRRQRTKKLGP